MCIINYTVKYFAYLVCASKFKVVTHLYVGVFFNLRKEMMLAFFLCNDQNHRDMTWNDRNNLDIFIIGFSM